jgi:hypothetical protein
MLKKHNTKIIKKKERKQTKKNKKKKQKLLNLLKPYSIVNKYQQVKYEMIKFCYLFQIDKLTIY